MPSAPSPSVPAPLGAAHDARSGPILIVEDEYLVASYLCAVLEDGGYALAGAAADAAEALAVARQVRPALALVDVRLARGDDGIELAKRLRRIVPGLPIVFVTGSGDPETRARAAQADPRAFLQKPVAPEALLAAIRLALA